ncbi:MAG: DUF3303 domain-containing protein [Gammaproteobacteria bacterium]|nr:DUF3303 domain-containing protein [Gammaproteobacteria bacterium]
MREVYQRAHSRGRMLPPGLEYLDSWVTEDFTHCYQLMSCDDLQPGDLQLFLGRLSLHRVTENTGAADRLLLIMSFAEKPAMIGSVHRSRELYGKVTDAHIEAERRRARNDSLMD